MRVYVGSLGCRLNQAEMDALAGRLAGAGHEVVALPAEAEVCILNTCAVTQVAAQKTRQALGRLHRQNPGARLIATGCYAELAPAELLALPGVERVVGNRAKDELAGLLGAPPAAGAADAVAHGARPRSRALVKIGDGCDNACTYCIVRVARGPQRSRPPEEIVQEVRSRRAEGYQEIVLTGVHIGAYGHDRQATASGGSLWQLVARLLEATDVPRLRLSSIEPWDLGPEALALWQNPRLCRHLHLPLQSGCDATLGRMARRYTAAQFAALAASARAAIPGLAITTDVIAGFPGETEEEFAESLSFVRAMQFARVHVFPYSNRPGTPAAEMPGQVPHSLRLERAAALRAVGDLSARAFEARFVGTTLDVLWESTRPSAGGPVWSGLTDNYLRVQACAAEDLANRIVPTRLAQAAEGRLWGLVGAQKTGDGCPSPVHGGLDQASA